MRAWLCAVLVVTACGSNAGTGDDDAQPDGGTADSPDGVTEPGWETLIQRSWTLQPNTEAYRCVSIPVTEDTYVSAIRGMSPVGTHHEILTTSATPFAMMGEYDCMDGDGGKELLFAGGLGTQDLAFPSGVAIKLAAGTYLNLNIHVTNFSDDPMTQTSGIEIKKIGASEVVDEAGMIFAGTFDIDIPPTNQPTPILTECGAPTTWHVLTLWPHMHKYGTRFHAYVERNGGGTEELLDTAYSYTDQKHYPMGLTLNTNDRLYAECIYVNDTNVKYPPGYTINYGESVNAEMCFTGMYKYPKGENKNFCVHPPE